MKFSILFLIIFLSGFILPLVSLANGLVPCGEPGNPCELCDLFVLLDNIVDFVLTKIIFPVAILLLIIGGFMFFFYAENPQRVEQGKSILTATIIGLVIILTAYLLVGTFLEAIGLANWTQDIYRNWWENGVFTIPCN